MKGLVKNAIGSSKKGMIYVRGAGHLKCFGERAFVGNSMFLPRTGHTLLLSFLSGIPIMPIIGSHIYEENMDLWTTMSLGVNLSVAAMHRILEKAGSDRISESACKELARVLEGIGLKIGNEAIDFALHAGRKTVKGRDVKIAAEKVMNR